MGDKIKLHGSLVEALFVNEDEESDCQEPGYEGWYCIADEDTGEYDSSKGAMVDFEIELFDANGNYKGSCFGGYYCQGDYSFDFGSDTYYEFEVTELTPEQLFNEFLVELSEDEDLTIRQKIGRIKNYKY